MAIYYEWSDKGPGHVECETRVRKEGSKPGGLRMPIAFRAVKKLVDDGWDKTWIEIELEGLSWIACARYHGKSLVVAVPLWRRARDFAIGEMLRFEARIPTPCKPATSLFHENGLDWAAVLPENAFGTDDGDDLLVHTRHEPPMRIRRMCPTDGFWLLGFYQAEGAKNSAPEWSLANSSAPLLQKTIDQLLLWGFDEKRIGLLLVREEDQSENNVRSVYKTLSLSVDSVRSRGKKAQRGTHGAGFLRIRSSLPLLRMTKSVLTEILDGDGVQRMTEMQCRQYAFGFFEGDAAVIGDGHCPGIRLCGHAEEREAAFLAIVRGLGWTDKVGRHAKSGKRPNGKRYESHISLTVDEALDLAATNVFSHSIGRFRLLDMIEQRMKNLRVLWDAFGTRRFRYKDAQNAGVVAGVLNLMRKWRLLEGNGERGFRFTKLARGVMVKAEKAEPELAAMRQVRARVPSWVPKGSPNPIGSVR